MFDKSDVNGSGNNNCAYGITSHTKVENARATRTDPEGSLWSMKDAGNVGPQGSGAASRIRQSPGPFVTEQP